MKKAALRICALVSTGLLAMAVTGCYNARDFKYRGAKLDTIPSYAIDNREPYPVTRDSWRLGPTREAVVNDEEILICGSEDGANIMFKVQRYAFGEKSKLLLESTERATRALDGLSKIIETDGFVINDRIAIIDSANVIGYKFGGEPRVLGFYILTEPGAYDALLPQLGSVTPEFEEGVEAAADEEFTKSTPSKSDHNKEE